MKVQSPAQVVTIFSWSLLATESEVDRMAETLSADERARAAAFRVAGKKDRFIVAHAGVRSILGREIGRPPAEVEFRHGPNGKPELLGLRDVRFSLSHSHDVAVLAVGRGFEIGVDVERLRHVDDVDRIAKRFFAESESQMVDRASGEIRDRLFMRLWTCKEAYLKATGDGLSRPLADVVVTLGHGGEVENLRTAAGAQLGASVHAFDPAPGYAGALVALAEEVSVRVEQWRLER